MAVAVVVLPDAATSATDMTCVALMADFYAPRDANHEPELIRPIAMFNASRAPPRPIERVRPLHVRDVDAAQNFRGWTWLGRHRERVQTIGREEGRAAPDRGSRPRARRSASHPPDLRGAARASGPSGRYERGADRPDVHRAVPRAARGRVLVPARSGRARRHLEGSTSR